LLGIEQIVGRRVVESKAAAAIFTIVDWPSVTEIELDVPSLRER